jgi:hypothetical protein
MVQTWARLSRRHMVPMVLHDRFVSLDIFLIARGLGLGILVVSGVPGFAEKRKRLLPLARRLAVSELFVCVYSDRALAHNPKNRNCPRKI